MNVKQRNYINSPVQLFMQQLWTLVEETWPEPDRRPELISALKALEFQACEEPSIVAWVDDAIKSNRGLFPEQLMLICLATFCRSSSTYASIPEIVTVLAGAGDYELAAMINDNAVHEAGTSRIQSHPKMLLSGIARLFESLNAHCPNTSFHPLNQSLIACLRFYFQLPESDRSKVDDNLEYLNCFAAQQAYWLPSTDVQDYAALFEYARIVPEGLFDYHHAIIRDLLGMGSLGTSSSNTRNSPTSQRWLAAQAIEFSFREASSADELPEKLSYVGAFGCLCRNYLGYVDNVSDKHQVMCWWVAHSDEEIGKALGWNDTAELGHARDARILVERIVPRISQEDLAHAIQSAAHMSELRNRHWQIVTNRLEELGAGQPDSQRIAFQDESYDSTECFSQVGLLH